MLGTFPYFMAINGITKDYTCSAQGTDVFG
jgi:hypothetical protein